MPTYLDDDGEPIYLDEQGNPVKKKRPEMAPTIGGSLGRGPAFPGVSAAASRAEETESKVKGSSIGRFVGGVSRTMVEPAAEMLLAAPHMIKESIMGRSPALGAQMYRGLREQSTQQYEKMHQTSGVESAGHAVAGTVPLVGPAAAEEGERIGRGDIAGGLGGMTGLLLPFVLGRAARGARAAAPAAEGAEGAARVRPSASPVTRGGTPPAPAAPPAAGVPPASSAASTLETGGNLLPGGAGPANMSRRNFLKTGAAATAGAAVAGPENVVRAAVKAAAPEAAAPAAAAVQPEAGLIRLIEADIRGMRFNITAAQDWRDGMATSPNARAAHQGLERGRAMLEDRLNTLRQLAPEEADKLAPRIGSIINDSLDAMDPNWINKGRLSKRTAEELRAARAARQAKAQPAPEAAPAQPAQPAAGPTPQAELSAPPSAAAEPIPWETIGHYNKAGYFQANPGVYVPPTGRTHRPWRPMGPDSPIVPTRPPDALNDIAWALEDGSDQAMNALGPEARGILRDMLDPTKRKDMDVRFGPARMGDLRDTLAYSVQANEAGVSRADWVRYVDAMEDHMRDPTRPMPVMPGRKPAPSTPPPQLQPPAQPTQPSITDNIAANQVQEWPVDDFATVSNDDLRWRMRTSTPEQRPIFEAEYQRRLKAEDDLLNGNGPLEHRLGPHQPGDPNYDPFNDPSLPGPGQKPPAPPGGAAPPPASTPPGTPPVPPTPPAEGGGGVPPTPPPAGAARAPVELPTVPLTLGERTGNRALQYLESSVESSFPGAKPFDRFRIAQQESLQRMADTVVGDISDFKGSPEELGMRFQKDMDAVSQGLKAEAANAYSEIDDLAKGVKPDITLVKSFATDALKEIAAKGKLVPPAESARVRAILTKLKKAPQQVEFGVLADARSDLMSITRKGGGGFISDKGVGTIKKITQLIDESMENAAKSDPALLKKFRETNARWRDIHETFDRSVVARMAKAPPEKVSGFLRSASLEDIDRLRSVTPPETWDAMRSSVVRSIFDEATEGEVARSFLPEAAEKLMGRTPQTRVKMKGPTLRKILEDKYGHDRLQRIFQDKPEQLKNVFRVLEVAEKVGHNPRSLLGTFVNFKMLASGVEFATTGNAAALVEPAVMMAGGRLLSKLMTKQWGSHVLQQWLRFGQKSQKGVYWAGRLREAIRAEEKAEAEKRSNPTSGGR